MRTYKEILNDMCARVTNCSTLEGSFIYTALAPFAMELADLYLRLDYDEQNSYADTADYEHLKLLAKDRGLYPYEATHAVALGKFNKEIPNGSRFKLNTTIWISSDKVSEGDGFYYYTLTSEGTGSQMNVAIGMLTPITFIQGLTYAELTQITIPARDEETQQAFLERYYETFNKKGFGGNKSDYIEKVGTYNGVGGCKVYPIWNGGGTVKIVVIDSDYNAPSSTLINLIQDDIDPLQDGRGDGYAPIGHRVTIAGVTNKTITVSVSLVLREGTTFATIKPLLITNINKYFKDVNSTWDTNTYITLRVAQVQNVILNTDGVIDINTCLINGVSSNIELTENEILKLLDIVEA